MRFMENEQISSKKFALLNLGIGEEDSQDLLGIIDESLVVTNRYKIKRYLIFHFT